MPQHHPVLSFVVAILLHDVQDTVEIARGTHAVLRLVDRGRADPDGEQHHRHRQYGQGLPGRARPAFAGASATAGF